MRKSNLCAAALAGSALLATKADAAISYTTPESTFTENFDSLPTGTNPFNGNTIPFNGSAHIQNSSPPAWSGGWKDDTTTDATNLGLPGWYLWSDVTTLTTSTGGANAHAQFRYGSGNATTGTGFFAFSSTPSDPNRADKALGIHSASAFTDSASGRRSYIGLQLTNNTAATLTSFTLTYDGEQYREAAGTSQDGFDLQWSLVASAAGWHDSPTTGGFYNNGVSGVDYGGFANSFLSPINNNPSAIAAVDGNVTGNRSPDISHPVSGITWAPGTELWIRWRDGFAHDGIAIDNVRFSAAVPEPTSLGLLALGGLALVRRRRSF